MPVSDATTIASAAKTSEPVEVNKAEAMNMTRRQADGVWLLARAWLYRELE